MEKRKTSSFDLAMDMIRASGQLISGRAPKAEKLATPGMKRVAKAIGDVAIYGWSSKPRG
jgi:hypothetical protein